MTAPHDLAEAIANTIAEQAKRPGDALPADRIATMLRALIARIEALEREVAALRRPPQA